MCVCVCGVVSKITIVNWRKKERSRKETISFTMPLIAELKKISQIKGTKPTEKEREGETRESGFLGCSNFVVLVLWGQFNADTCNLFCNTKTMYGLHFLLLKMTILQGLVNFTIFHSLFTEQPKG